MLKFPAIQSHSADVTKSLGATSLRSGSQEGKLLKISYYDADGLAEYMLYYYNEHGATSAYEIYLAHGGQEGLFERVEFTYE